MSSSTDPLNFGDEDILDPRSRLSDEQMTQYAHILKMYRPYITTFISSLYFKCSKLLFL